MQSWPCTSGEALPRTISECASRVIMKGRGTACLGHKNQASRGQQSAITLNPCGWRPHTDANGLEETGITGSSAEPSQSTKSVIPIISTAVLLVRMVIWMVMAECCWTRARNAQSDSR